MTTLLSSPMGPPMRFDLFEQQGSPTLCPDDLPAEFGDRSFGSSMSLGSSFDPHVHRTGILSASGSGNTINALLESNATPSSSASSLASHSSPSPPRSITVITKRQSPTSSRRLGEAMGTELNGKSPGLAAKMSSPHYMDISPAPLKTSMMLPSDSSSPQQYQPLAGPSTLYTPGGVFKSVCVPSSCLPPGSAMKEDSPSASSRRSIRSNSSHSSSRTSSRNSSRGSSPEGLATTSGTQGVPVNSLGRLFGTALSANKDLTVDPDCSFEMPAAKRRTRPSSLPMGEGRPHPRPSLQSIGMRKPSNSHLDSARTEDAFRRRASHDLARKKMHRSSEPALGPLVPPSCQQSTTEPAPSFAAQGLPAGFSNSSSFGGQCHERAEKMGLASRAIHNTIIESPSPGTLERQDLGSYFFDPQSPETSQQAITVTGLAQARPNTQQPTARPPLIKAHTQLEHSACKRKVDERKIGMTNASKALGARPPIRPSGMYVKSSGSVFQKAESAFEGQRQKVPAPRRALSTFEAPSMLLLPDSSSRDSINMMEGPSPSPAGGRRFPDGFDADGSPIAPSNKRPGLPRRTSKDDSSPLVLGSHRNRARNDAGLSSVADDSGGLSSSTSFGAECMPGFGASERRGKVLPCFNVKEDGLMRITPETLVSLLKGDYNDKLERYQVVDCRFGYEYEGGHIPGAINLSTVERVKTHFLSGNAGPLPSRSQSGKADEHGNLRKTILVFHCEFSAKRAPTMALALRQADRELVNDYPNCHYPEVYILQGGYSGFFNAFSSVCEPPAYVQMDDPSYQDQRSLELNGFRKQFARHRSFTYGEVRRAELPSAAGRPASGFVRDPRTATMICEESAAESSFEQDSSPSNFAAVNRQLRGDEVDFAGIPASSSIGDSSLDSDAGLPVAASLSAAPRGPADISPCAQAALQHKHLPLRKSSLGPGTNGLTSIKSSMPPPAAGRRQFRRADTTGGFLHIGRT